MKKNATKVCDLCGVVVAEKYFLRYHTVRDFVTMRGDEEPKYPDDIAATDKNKWHFCTPCWLGIMHAAKEALKARKSNGNV